MNANSGNSLPSLRILGILGCTKTKIWDADPDYGPAPAREAYRGQKFRKDLEIVDSHSTRWIILSAKYGFMDPDFLIPGVYNATFNPNSDSTEPPVPLETLIRQVKEMNLDSFDIIRFFSSCGDLYKDKVREAFQGLLIRFDSI